MKCPICGREKTKVLDSRETSGNEVRRRRECVECKERFSTIERIEVLQPGTALVSPIPEPQIPINTEFVLGSISTAPIDSAQEPHKAKTGHILPYTNKRAKRQQARDLIERLRDARRCARGF